MHAHMFLLLVASLAAAPAPAEVRAKVRQYRATHEVQLLRDFRDLLAIPNLATDTANIRRNADFISAELQKRGLKTQLLEVPKAPPLVYGELPAPGATQTVLFYAHYDGQPVDPSLWKTAPWSPTLRAGALESGAAELSFDALRAPVDPGAFIYARSAGDDKAPIAALLGALDALKAGGISRTVNLKVLLEGEEEAGSPHLAEAVKKHAALLKGDVWLFCDGPVHQSRQMQVYLGARGVTTAEITLYGPMRALHSGHYGNWAPNPAVLAAELVTSLRDANAHVLIPGFYDDVRPLTVNEKAALQAMPDVDAALKHELGIAATESSGELVQQAIMHPALNIRGIASGHVGDKAQNAVPTDATVSIDFRLVPSQTPEKVRAQLEAFLAHKGFTVVRDTPDAELRRAKPRLAKVTWPEGGYVPARTDMDLPIVHAVIGAIEATLGKKIIVMPMLGGSIPMYVFLDGLHTPVVGVPIANHDDNQHGPNENLRVQNLWDGIEIFAGLLTSQLK
jgi:acetylornithine deacetylase/succinyl-diaminopimelate desuccinylase-like protein